MLNKNEVMRSKIIKMIRARNTKIKALQSELYGKTAQNLTAYSFEAGEDNFKSDTEILLSIPFVQQEFKTIDESSIDLAEEGYIKDSFKKNVINNLLNIKESLII